MAVYVDQPGSKLGRMVMCHMLADSTEELLEMARIVGVPAHHIQYPGTTKEHFDICLTKRKKALLFGAKEISTKQMVEILRERRRAEALASSPTALRVL